MIALQTDIHFQLVEDCRSGSRSAQYQLYKLYSKAMYNVAWRILNNDEEAEDVLQESFVKAFQHLDVFRGESTFGAWLKRIVINNALSKLKSRRLVFEPLSDKHDGEYEDDTAVADDVSYSIERVKSAIALLPDGYRSVLCLYLLEGYDHNEISEILGITVSTSKSQYKRAKDHLKKQLEQNGKAR